jgi:hypothetical protein
MQNIMNAAYIFPHPGTPGVFLLMFSREGKVDFRYFLSDATTAADACEELSQRFAGRFVPGRPEIAVRVQQAAHARNVLFPI